jgi:molybdopterin-guanine dinucleotide biosynthesis protein A
MCMFTIVIQAGGQSNRMGRNKALLPFLGQPLIERVLNRILSLADEILVTTNHPEGYRFLNVPLIPDVIPGIGALGGLYTALKAAIHPFVGIVACDMPFVNPDLLNLSRDTLINSDFDAVIPSSKNGLEPLHAIYRRETCLPPIEKAIQAGNRRVISWHEVANIRILTPDETAQYNSDGITFWNINTPEEFQEAEEKAREIEAKNS